MDMIAFRQYAAFTATTAIYPTQIEAEYLALGICSEVAECLELIEEGTVAFTSMLFSKTLAKEIGDVQWYVARICAHFDFDYATVVQNALLNSGVVCRSLDAILNRMSVQAGLIAGKVKKQLRDGHSWNGAQREEVRRTILTYLTKLIQLTKHVCDWFALSGYHEFNSYEKLLAGNTAKLSDRKDRGVLAGSGDNR